MKRSKHMRVPRLTILLGVAIALMGAAPARAADLVEDTRRAIEQTDHRIDQAEALVSTSTSDLASDELNRARNIQANAKSEFAAEHYRVAADLTMRARGHADRAIAIIRGLPDPDRVVVQVERTRELLDRARERIEECDDDRARAMIRAAIDMQQRAEQAVSEGRYLAALQLTMSARERGLRALRMCHMQDNVRENAERAMRRTDDVIGRAHEVVAESDSPPAHDALDRSMHHQDRARADFAAGRFEPCLRATHAARALAFRAIRLAGRE